MNYELSVWSNRRGDDGVARALHANLPYFSLLLGLSTKYLIVQKLLRALAVDAIRVVDCLVPA